MDFHDYEPDECDEYEPDEFDFHEYEPDEFDFHEYEPDECDFHEYEPDEFDFHEYEPDECDDYEPDEFDFHDYEPDECDEYEPDEFDFHEYEPDEFEFHEPDEFDESDEFESHESENEFHESQYDEPDETHISICSWNIMGSSAANMAGYRKAVTTETFSSTPILGQADIICLQELAFDPTGRVAKRYLPFLDDYTCCSSCETEGQNKYNAIYYRTKKFAIKRYTALGEMETKSPYMLLKRRMAICCLKHKQIPHYKLVVVSLHNYSKKGKEKFARLLFHFLDKIEVPVLIAGDFNFDITKVPSLKDKFLHNYLIKDYIIRPLRQHLPKNTQPRIDFICLKDDDTLGYTTELLDTVAHDLKVPRKINIEEKKITNHSPLSATLSVKP